MDRRRQIQQWLAIRERDGLTYRELSRRVGVPANTLAHWAWRLRRDAADRPSGGSKFIELIDPSAPHDTPSSRVEIVTRSDRRVIVDAHIDVAVLTRILLAVERC